MQERGDACSVLTGTEQTTNRGAMDIPTQPIATTQLDFRKTCPLRQKEVFLREPELSHTYLAYTKINQLKIFSYSNICLSRDEINVLSKGLKLTPTPETKYSEELVIFSRMSKKIKAERIFS